MITNIKLLMTALLLIVSVLSIKAQVIEIRSGNVLDIPKYFEGAWKGEGKFANGKIIRAAAVFKLSLDSCWLVYSHEDQLPNDYKTTSMWGIDKSKAEFPAIVFDNSHDKRDFSGTLVNNDELILLYKSKTPSVQYYERFIYKILDHNHFRMSYEISKDTVDWKQGDFLVFSRQ